MAVSGRCDSRARLPAGVCLGEEPDECPGAVAHELQAGCGRRIPGVVGFNGAVGVAVRVEVSGAIEGCFVRTGQRGTIGGGIFREADARCGEQCLGRNVCPRRGDEPTVTDVHRRDHGGTVVGGTGYECGDPLHDQQRPAGAHRYGVCGSVDLHDGGSCAGARLLTRTVAGPPAERDLYAAGGAGGTVPVGSPGPHAAQLFAGKTDHDGCLRYRAAL